MEEKTLFPQHTLKKGEMMPEMFHQKWLYYIPGPSKFTHTKKVVPSLHKYGAHSAAGRDEFCPKPQTDIKRY